jgi:hypothetical protein
VLDEIRGFYGELKDFWTEEVHHVIDALRRGRTDPRDFERWNDFYSSLKQTIESWKVCRFFFYYVCSNRPEYRV